MARFGMRLVQMVILVVVFFGIFALMSTCMHGQFEQQRRKTMSPQPFDSPGTSDRPIIVIPRRESEPMSQEPWGRHPSNP
jgi:hypothetical protein